MLHYQSIETKQSSDIHPSNEVLHSTSATSMISPNIVNTSVQRQSIHTHACDELILSTSIKSTISLTVAQNSAVIPRHLMSEYLVLL